MSWDDFAWLIGPGGAIAVIVGWLARHRVFRRVSGSWIARRFNAEKHAIQLQEEVDGVKASLARREVVWYTERDEILARSKRREDAWGKERSEMITQMEWLIASLDRLTVLSGAVKRAHESGLLHESEPSSPPPTNSVVNLPRS